MTKPNAPINSIPDLNNHPSEWYGLTKREYFAAMALQGLLSTDNDHSPHNWYGEKSVELADALIKALNESKSQSDWVIK